MVELTDRVAGMMAVFGLVVALMNYSIAFNADWVTYSNHTHTLSGGLWRECAINSSGYQTCSSLIGHPDKPGN